MRFLVDENMPVTAAARLREDGHDVAFVREILPGAGDERVIAAAHAEGRVLLTFDKDFGEWVFLRGKEVPGLILFRTTRAMPRAAFSNWIVEVVRSRSDWAGTFATVTDDARIRVRPLAVGS